MDENNPGESKVPPFNDGDESSLHDSPMDEMMSDDSQALSELVFSPDPITAQEVATKTQTDVETVTDIATTLVSAGYLITDSTVPGLDETARFIPDPIVSNAIQRAETFHAVNSKSDLETAIQKHEQTVKTLKDRTGMESAEEFNEAVFNEDSHVEETPSNQDKALKWILTEGQLQVLRDVASNYDSYSDDYEFLEEEFGFTQTSRNPPEMDKEQYLEVPEPPF